MKIALKRLFLGHPIKRSEMHAEQLPKRTAFGVFASDALSSIGYAPGELLYQFSLAGAAALSLGYLLPVSFFIIATAWVVILLYRVVITHYPHGGGTYTVTKEHLGDIPSLITASALIIDYILTVSVSVTSGIAQAGTIFPFFDAHRVAVCVCVVACVALINLRGYRESGNIFSIPLYGFLSAFTLLLLAGLLSWLKGTLPHAGQFSTAALSVSGGVGIFLIMRSFASGCSALTGIEAISNGVPVFREPSAKNARTTIVVLGFIISVFLLGAGALTHAIGIVPQNPEILIPTLGSLVFGSVMPAALAKIALGFLATSMCVILLIAANTSFADLPRLSSILAKDGYLPRQFRNRGDRQVFSVGIIVLAVVSSLLIMVFRGQVSPLIPFYGIGVFTTFSMLGWSMVAHVLRPRPSESDAEAPRDAKTLLTGIAAGTVSTAVLGVFLVTKFAQGAFAVVIVVPLLIMLFRGIRKSYARYEEGLRLEPGKKFLRRKVTNTIVIAVGRIDKSTLKSVNRAQDIIGRKIAVHIAEEGYGDDEFRRQWEALDTDIPLVMLHTEYNSLTSPLIRYIREIRREENAKEMKDPSYIHHLYVVLGEIVPDSLAENILHNQMAFLLYEQLRSIPEITPILVRYSPSKLPPSARWHGFGKRPASVGVANSCASSERKEHVLAGKY
jgi:amino acid transporter